MALRDRMGNVDRDELHPQGIRSKRFVEWLHDYLMSCGMEEIASYEAALEIWKEVRINGA